MTDDVELTGDDAEVETDATATVDGAETEKFTPPEGMEEGLYDNGLLSADKVRERIEALKSEVETANTNANNMRKKLSVKGQAPEKIEDYGEYEPAEEFKKFYDNDAYKEGLAENLKFIDQLAFDNGFTKEQCKAVKDALNQFMLTNGILEDEETISKRNEEYVAAEREKLGKNADELILKNVRFVENDNRFNEQERELLINFMDTKGAAAINIINKIRMGIGGQYAEDNIIPTGKADGIASDTELAREYYAKDTSPARRAEIMQQRIDAGRTGRLPQPDAI